HEDDLFTVEVFLNVKLTMYSSCAFYKRRYRPNSTMTYKSSDGRKRSFNSRCIVLNELNNLLGKYIDNNEVNLIKKRIRALTAALIYNYDDIDKSYRRKKLKRLESLSPFLHYYYSFKRKIGIMKTLLKK